MADKSKGVAVLHKGIFTGDPLIDGHQDFLLPQELQQVAQIVSLPLDDLSHAHRRRKLASQIPLTVRCLKLPH